MKAFISALLIVGIMVFAMAQDTEKMSKEMEKETQKTEQAENPIVMMTIAHGDSTLGTAEIEVFKNEMPNNADNFLKLVEEGYYDSLTFHRVVPNFVVQGGDPTGTGTGGPPGRLKDDETAAFKHDYGTIAMARSAAGASKSQFYVNLRNNYSLDSQGFQVFAEVVEGMDIFEHIATVETTGERQSPKPVTPVVMTKVWVKDGGEKKDMKAKDKNE